MNLVFERGDRGRPVGHALLYFRANDGSVLATYVVVPPIKFDLKKMVPGFMAGALQGMDFALGSEMMATPIPPIPEEVPGIDYLRALAAQREDDLIFAGGVVRSEQDAMILIAEAGEAARAYGELYAALPDVEPTVDAESGSRGEELESARFADMTERERLTELTTLTGRLRDSLLDGGPDPALEREMEALARHLPAKYRPQALVRAARTPGENGRKLADLYLERSFKLLNEDYLDLERIDRAIDALEP